MRGQSAQTGDLLKYLKRTLQSRHKACLPAVLAVSNPSENGWQQVHWQRETGVCVHESLPTELAQGTTSAPCCQNSLTQTDCG